jgi:hypothetical protein
LKLLIILIFFVQSGRYNIDSVDSKHATGTVTINPYHVKVTRDSTVVYYPVTRIFNDHNKTYYFLEGQIDGKPFKGAAIFHYSRSIDEKKIYVLYIEVRTQLSYDNTRYTLYVY